MEFPAFEWIRISRKWNISLARKHWELGQLKCSILIKIHLLTDKSSCARVLACFTFFFFLICSEILREGLILVICENAAATIDCGQNVAKTLITSKIPLELILSRPRYRGLCPSSYVASSSGRQEMTVSVSVGEPCIIRKWNLCLYLVSVVILTFWVCGWNLMMWAFKWNFFRSILSHGTIYLVCSSNVWVCGWNPKV